MDEDYPPSVRWMSPYHQGTTTSTICWLPGAIGWPVNCCRWRIFFFAPPEIGLPDCFFVFLSFGNVLPKR